MALATPTYVLTRRLFLRLLGVVWFLAFVSLAGQIVGLVGERGIMPAGRFLDWVGSSYGAGAWRQLPTVFWLGASDGALRTVAWGGAVLSILLVFGVAPVPVLFLLWALYLSLAVAGQDFLSFQWDALLLETGLLAMLWAPAAWRLGRRERSPPELARLLVGHLATGLAQEGVREQAAAHPYLAMDPPDGQVDPGAVERDPPRQDVLVHAVDERTVEVEEEPLRPIHVAMLRAGRSTAPVVPSGRARCYTRAVS